LRRQKLALSVRAAAGAAGIDRATWTSLEAGTRVVQDRSHAAIEDVLQWPPGSIAAFVEDGVDPGVDAGNDPTPGRPSSPAGDDDPPPGDLLPFDDVEQQIWAIKKLGA
jgi:hypothetical protein